MAILLHEGLKTRYIFQCRVVRIFWIRSLHTLNTLFPVSRSHPHYIQWTWGLFLQEIKNKKGCNIGLKEKVLWPKHAVKVGYLVDIHRSSLWSFWDDKWHCWGKGWWSKGLVRTRSWLLWTQLSSCSGSRWSGQCTHHHSDMALRNTPLCLSDMSGLEYKEWTWWKMTQIFTFIRSSTIPLNAVLKLCSSQPHYMFQSKCLNLPNVYLKCNILK